MAGPGRVFHSFSTAVHGCWKPCSEAGCCRRLSDGCRRAVSLRRAGAACKSGPCKSGHEWAGVAWFEVALDWQVRFRRASLVMGGGKEGHAAHRLGAIRGGRRSRVDRGRLVLRARLRPARARGCRGGWSGFPTIAGSIASSTTRTSPMRSRTFSGCFRSSAGAAATA